MSFDPLGPLLHLPDRVRDTEDEPFVSHFVLRISTGNPASSLDVPMRMEHGSRTGHAAEHGMLAAVLAGAIERTLENHYADAEIEVEVVP